MFKLREQGSSRTGMRNEARSPCKPVCLGLWCIHKNKSKGRGGLERELPGGAIYINALEIVPLSHYHGRLLSVTSQGGFLVFLCRCMSLYRAPPLCGSL